MKNKIIKILAESKERKIPISEFIHELFYAIAQLESFGMIETEKSFNDAKIDSLEITKLGREFYKEKILKK